MKSEKLFCPEITLPRNVKHMLQTLPAIQNQSLQQKHFILPALPAERKTKKEKITSICNNFNPDTHANPDKSAVNAKNEV